jgi:hypothetical protein
MLAKSGIEPPTRGFLHRALGFMAIAVTVDPLLRNLHGDPRFQALLTKMKLDDWKRKHLAKNPNGYCGLERCGVTYTPSMA